MRWPQRLEQRSINEGKPRALGTLGGGESHARAWGKGCTAYLELDPNVALLGDASSGLFPVHLWRKRGHHASRRSVAVVRGMRQYSRYMGHGSF
jgi:hypothetical protein